MSFPRADSEHSCLPSKFWDTRSPGGSVSPTARASARAQPCFPRAAQIPGVGAVPGLGAQGAVPGGCSRVWWHLAHASTSLLCQAQPGVFPEVAPQELWLHGSRLGARPARWALAMWQEETCLLQDAYTIWRHCSITWQPILWLSVLQKRKNKPSALEEKQYAAPRQ